MENNKINIAELLRNCPKGMELDSTMYDTKVFYQGLNKRIPTHPITVQTQHGFEFELTQYGQIHNIVGSKCVIFPKGKTTWEGFNENREFKDGEIAVYESAGYKAICIVKGGNYKDMMNSYVKLSTGGQLTTNNRGYVNRYATEEEKEKLFQAIKDNGFKWNAETKTLETLIEPKFKVGDRVKHKQSFISGVITNIDDDCYKIKYDSGAVSFAIIKDQDDWELVSDEIEPEFKVGDKIRLKGNPNYIYTITDIRENKSGCGVTFDLRFSEQDKNGNWFPKFDISTLVPFESRVLVRNAEEDIWKPAIFGCNADKTSRYYVLGGTCWSYCIPYEGNEHLCGKIDDCDEYYKTWE